MLLLSEPSSRFFSARSRAITVLGCVLQEDRLPTSVQIFPVIDTWMERLSPYMAAAIAAIYVIYLIFAVGAYGLIQALIALDATIAACRSES